jgi:DNA topoisomerase-1
VTKTAEKVEQKSGIACVLCGAEMMVKNGKFGQFLACSGYPTCKHTQPMPEDQNKLNLLKEKYKDEKCPKCGKGMIVKNSKFGEFLACEDYPQCKTTKNIAGVTEFKCPKCKTGDILRKRSHKGRFFYACTNYPTCDYVSWAKPEGICPTCSALMYLKGKKIICSGCGVEAVRTAD